MLVNKAKIINLGVAFLFEIGMLVALSSWGIISSNSLMGKLALGVGIPLLAIVFWGIFAAPKSQHRLSQPALSLFTATLFITSALALFAIGQTLLAALYACIAITSTALSLVWKQ